MIIEECCGAVMKDSTRASAVVIVGFLRSPWTLGLLAEPHRKEVLDGLKITGNCE